MKSNIDARGNLLNEKYVPLYCKIVELIKKEDESWESTRPDEDQDDFYHAYSIVYENSCQVIIMCEFSNESEYQRDFWVYNKEREILEAADPEIDEHYREQDNNNPYSAKIPECPVILYRDEEDKVYEEFG